MDGGTQFLQSGCQDRHKATKLDLQAIAAKLQDRPVALQQFFFGFFFPFLTVFFGLNSFSDSIQRN